MLNDLKKSFSFVVADVRFDIVITISGHPAGGDCDSADGCTQGHSPHLRAGLRSSLSKNCRKTSINRLFRREQRHYKVQVGL